MTTTTNAGLGQERAFGRSVGTVLALIGVYQIVRGRTTAGAWFVTIGAVLAVLGTFAPSALARPSRWWWRFSHALGWVNSRVLLSVFFFAVLTPVGLVFRLFGRDPLSQRATPSTWSPYPQRPRNHYERLF